MTRPRGRFRATAAAAAFALAIVSATRAHVLIVTSDYVDGFKSRVTDVQALLTNTGRLAGRVDVFDASAATPTAGYLSNYSAVLVFGENAFASPAGLGTALANFADTGRTVVEAAFCGGAAGGSGLLGRWTADAYTPFTTFKGYKSGSFTIGTRHVPASPLLTNVNAFNGGAGGSWHNLVSLAPGATLVADWSNNDPLVAHRASKPGTIVGLNFYPPPRSSERADFWVPATDGGWLMTNALNMKAAPEPGSALLVLLSIAPLLRRRRRMRRPAASLY